MLNNSYPSSLDRSFQSSQQIMKVYSHSFFQAFKLLPTDMFKGVSALYAYNRYVDDLVDTSDISETEALACLDHLEHAVSSLVSGQEVHQVEFTQLNWWPAFAHTINKYQIPLQPLIDQIDGQRLDLQKQLIGDIDDLIYYAKKVAGSVGLMLLPILVEDHQYISPSLKVASQNLGIAMQLTNILRDVGEDYRDHNRIYLPKQLMAKHFITKETIGQLANSPKIQHPVIPVNMIALWEEIASYSTTHYEQIYDHIQSFHPKARLPLLASARIYRNIEEVVRQNDYNCFTKRQYTSKSNRTKLIQQTHRYLMTE